jgi:DNA-binding NtrC family response regulator
MHVSSVTDNIRVLIVDDDSDVRSFLKTVLMTKSIETHENFNGLVKKIKTFDPHVIILDYLLEDGSALDILEEIQPYTKKCIPVIFTANKIPEPIQTQLYIYGVMNIIYKPCNISTIEAIVENYYEISMKYRA